MEIKEYLYVLRKRVVLIVTVTILATILSGVVSKFLINPTYKSDISVIIGKSESTTTQQNSNYQDIMMYQQVVKTYSNLATSKKVAQDVIDELQLNLKVDKLQKMISTTPQANTQFLTITVKSQNAEEAMKIANQEAKSLKKISKEVMKADNVQIIDEAELPTFPSSPRTKLNIAIAFLLGLMVSVGIAFLLEYLDSTVKNQEEIEKMLQLPILGLIPFEEDNKKEV